MLETGWDGILGTVGMLLGRLGRLAQVPSSLRPLTTMVRTSAKLIPRRDRCDDSGGSGVTVWRSDVHRTWTDAGLLRDWRLVDADTLDFSVGEAGRYLRGT